MLKRLIPIHGKPRARDLMRIIYICNRTIHPNRYHRYTSITNSSGTQYPVHSNHNRKTEPPLLRRVQLIFSITLQQCSKWKSISEQQTNLESQSNQNLNFNQIKRNKQRIRRSVNPSSNKSNMKINPNKENTTISDDQRTHVLYETPVKPKMAY